MSTTSQKILSSEDSSAVIISYDAANLSPIELITHLAKYGPRDPTFLGFKSPGTHYRTTSGFIVNLFIKQGVRRDHAIKDAFVLKFDDERDRYDCKWTGEQIEVIRVNGEPKPITIVMDTVTDC